jgi:formylglycine-generating enzyme required for sulfatase activity
MMGGFEMYIKVILGILVLIFAVAGVIIAVTVSFRHEVEMRETAVQREFDRIGIQMVEIPGCSFRMGTDKVEKSLTLHYRVHTVTLSPYLMSATEITSAQYFRVTGVKLSQFYGGEKCPVVMVSWMDAARFCNGLSKRLKLERCYNEITWKCDYGKNGFRLPTEAEWE